MGFDLLLHGLGSIHDQLFEAQLALCVILDEAFEAAFEFGEFLGLLNEDGVLPFAVPIQLRLSQSTGASGLS